MPWLKKHGRLIQIMMMVSIPILVSFCSGVWLSHLFTESQYKGVGESQSRKLVVEAQMLADQLTQKVDDLKVQASMIAQLHTSLSPRSEVLFSPRSGITLWAELELQGNSSGRVRVRRWVSSLERGLEAQYLSKIVKELEQSRSKLSSALQYQGVYAPESVRLSGATNSPGYSLVFQGQDSNRTAHLLLVDPSLLFTPLQQWQRHSQGGLSQSVLLDAKSQVLSQSHPNSKWLEKLMGHAFFRFQLEKLTQRITFQGKGEFTLQEGSSIQASFLALPHLPWFIVVGEKKLSAQAFIPWQHGVLWLYSVLVFVVILSCLGFVSLYLEKNLKQILPITLVSARSDLARGVSHSISNDWQSDAMHSPLPHPPVRDLDH